MLSRPEVAQKSRAAKNATMIEAVPIRYMAAFPALIVSAERVNVNAGRSAPTAVTETYWYLSFLASSFVAT
jgi:hypothetical protein